MKFNKNQALGFTSKFSEFEIINQEFTRCKCYILATGDNVNGSDITLEAVKKAMDRGEFYNKPIIAHLYKDEENGKWRVGGHDSKWIITDTSFDIVNECIAFGTIPESSDLKLEEVLEPDGETVNTYLTCQIILWSGRFNIMDAAYNDDIYFNQSCEISINEYHWKDNDVIAIDDFTFSALCLLNKSDDKSKNIRPCFPSCRVEKIKSFSINESKFKQNFELMLEKLKQYESDASITASAQNNTTNNNPITEGENEMDFVKITEALSKSDDNCTYRLLNATDSKVYALDGSDYKPYGFDYAVTKTDDTESIVIDFESKTEMSLSATDKIVNKNFNEFSIKNEIDTIKETYAKQLVDDNSKKIGESLSAEFNQNYSKLKEDYDTLSESYKLISERLAVFEEKENEQKEREHKKEIDDLVNTYAEKLGKYSKFLVYKAQIEEHYSKSVDEVKQDLIFMAGNYLTSQENSLKKNFSYNPTEARVSNRNKATTNSKYGHLLDKYIK